MTCESKQVTDNLCKNKQTKKHCKGQYPRTCPSDPQYKAQARVLFISTVHDT